MYKILLACCLLLSKGMMAQVDTLGGRIMADSSSGAMVQVHKDPRIDSLIRRQIAINEETTRDSRRNMPGFRIQVITSTDRNKVFAAKSRIYQEFPDLKPYLLYQAPNYKLRVGNFKTEEEAEDFEKQLSLLFPTGLYIIRDIIEVKPSDVLPNP